MPHRAICMQVTKYILQLNPVECDASLFQVHQSCSRNLSIGPEKILPPSPPLSYLYSWVLAPVLWYSRGSYSLNETIRLID